MSPPRSKPGTSPPLGAAPGAGASLTLVVPGAADADPTQEALNAWTRAVALDQDRAAFARLFEHFAPRLKSWLMRTGSTPEVADELVQDAFIVLWRKAAQFDPARAGVAAWLFTIARNLRVDRHRGSNDAWCSLDEHEVAEVPDPGVAPDERIADRELGDSVRRALARLTSDQRTLLQLSYYDEKSQSCIALEMRLPLGTVKTRMRRAAIRLRELLGETRS